MSKLKCEILSRSNSVHLQQLFNGFNLLYKHGVVDLKVRKANFSGLPGNKPIVKVIVNDIYHIVYDILDGYNYFDHKAMEENLDFLDSLLNQCDYYYKRSYSTLLNVSLNNHKKIKPLGLNYLFSLHERDCYAQKRINSNDFKACIQHIRNGDFGKLKSAIPQNILSFPSMDELIQTPAAVKDAKVVFIPRLWQDDAVPGTDENRFAALNDHRIEMIRQLKQQFQDRFIGGVMEDSYSRQLCPELCVSYSRKEYLRLMNDAAICISTEGLHGSIGWKFAEYLLASKCIVSEPLQYALPGDFLVGANYLQFETIDGCLANIDFLLGDATARNTMMQRNFDYAKQYLYPEAFVLNTLHSVFGSL